MSTKIQLAHPAGKKAIRMEQPKYELIATSILHFLSEKKQATHIELLAAVETDFQQRKVEFKGSIGWHTEWVKLDLEAKGKILRKQTEAPQLYILA